MTREKLVDRRHRVVFIPRGSSARNVIYILHNTVGSDDVGALCHQIAICFQFFEYVLPTVIRIQYDHDPVVGIHQASYLRNYIGGNRAPLDQGNIRKQEMLLNGFPIVWTYFDIDAYYSTLNTHRL